MGCQQWRQTAIERDFGVVPLAGLRESDTGDGLGFIERVELLHFHKGAFGLDYPDSDCAAC